MSISFSEIKKRLPSEKTKEHYNARKIWWKDANKIGKANLSLAELEGFIVNQLGCEDLNVARPAIKFAHKFARQVNPKGDADDLEWCEFRLLLVYLKDSFDIYEGWTSIDKSGKYMKLAELEKAAPALASLGISVDAKTAFDKMKGSDESVSFNEFCDWAIKTGLTGDKASEFQNAVQEAKEKGLSPNEFAEVMTAIKAGKPPADTEVTVKTLKHLFTEADANKDGTLSKDELTKIFKSIQKADMSDQDFELLFKDADANGDGKYVVDEFLDAVFQRTVPKGPLPVGSKLTDAMIDKKFAKYVKLSEYAPPECMDFCALEALENDFVIKQSVSGDAKAWKDGAISKTEFKGWLEKSGYILPNSPAVDAKPPPLSTWVPLEPALIEEKFAKYIKLSGHAPAGCIDFLALDAVDADFIIKQSVTGNAKEWQDGGISLKEFKGWLKASGYTIIGETE